MKFSSVIWYIFKFFISQGTAKVKRLEEVSCHVFDLFDKKQDPSFSFDKLLFSFLI
jgi:hypothetical protein